MLRPQHYPAGPPVAAEPRREPPAVVPVWLLSQAWKRAWLTTWTVERISEWPAPHSRLQTTG